MQVYEDDLLPDANEERGRTDDDVCHVYELSEEVEVLDFLKKYLYKKVCLGGT